MRSDWDNIRQRYYFLFRVGDQRGPGLAFAPMRDGVARETKDE
jgi:hypothetical protein